MNDGGGGGERRNRLSAGGVRTTIAKHHGRYSKDGVKMAWSERLDCGVNICNYAVDIYNFTASNIRASNLPACDFPASNFPIDLVIIV